jgi:nucleoside-diphosphate-sugar epimerase
VEAELQLVHEDDVVSALVGLIDGRHGGAFNVTADGMMTVRESAELIGLRVREMKFGTVYRIYSWAWRLHVPNVGAPAGNLHFLRHPWVVSNEKLKATGWESSHDSREVYVETMRAKGLIEAGPEPTATLPATGA